MLICEEGHRQLRLCDLAGVSVQQILTDTDTLIVVVASPGVGGSSGSVVIVATSGAIVSAAGAWQYATEGVIASVAPSVGQFGTLVVTTGTGLRGNGSV